MAGPQGVEGRVEGGDVVVGLGREKERIPCLFCFFFFSLSFVFCRAAPA